MESRLIENTKIIHENACPYNCTGKATEWSGHCLTCLTSSSCLDYENISLPTPIVFTNYSKSCILDIAMMLNHIIHSYISSIMESIFHYIQQRQIR